MPKTNSNEQKYAKGIFPLIVHLQWSIFTMVWNDRRIKHISFPGVSTVTLIIFICLCYPYNLLRNGSSAKYCNVTGLSTIVESRIATRIYCCKHSGSLLCTHFCDTLLKWNLVMSRLTNLAFAGCYHKSNVAKPIARLQKIKKEEKTEGKKHDEY